MDLFVIGLFQFLNHWLTATKCYVAHTVHIDKGDGIYLKGIDLNTCHVWGYN